MSIRRANSPFMTAEQVQADPVERLAAHLYETEPGPPGPADPPYGSDQTPIVERRRYRAKALRMLAADDMLEALETAERAFTLHVFSPRGHDRPEDRDACRICGGNYRDTHAHITAQEGHPSDVKAEAIKRVRAAIAKADGEGEA